MTVLIKIEGSTANNQPLVEKGCASQSLLCGRFVRRSLIVFDESLGEPKKRIQTASPFFKTLAEVLDNVRILESLLTFVDQHPYYIIPIFSNLLKLKPFCCSAMIQRPWNWETSHFQRTRSAEVHGWQLWLLQSYWFHGFIFGRSTRNNGKTWIWINIKQPANG